jgi:protein-tyrosine phosphatase
MSQRASTGATRGEAVNRLVVDQVDLSGIPGFRDVGSAGGRLGMTSLAGARELANRGAASAVDAILLLVEDHELDGVPLAEGIDLLRFPIPDMDVTSDRDGLRLTLDDVLGRLRAGQTVVVACFGGLGRTGTVVACLLRDGGLDADSAIALTRASRPRTIERDSQLDFVAGWPG